MKVIGLNSLSIRKLQGEMTSQTGFEKESSQVAQGLDHRNDQAKLPPAVTRNYSRPQSGREVMTKIKVKILVSSLLFVMYALQYRVSSLQRTLLETITRQYDMRTSLDDGG